MTEDELSAAVVELVKERKLYVLRIPDSRRVRAGWPDLSILSPKKLLFRELKQEEGRLTSPQVAMKYALISAGQDYKVWKPSDLQSGRIARELDDLV